MSLKTTVRPFTEDDTELDNYLVRRSGLFNDTRLEKQINQLIKTGKATKETVRDAFVMAPLIIVKKKAAEDIIGKTTPEERWNALNTIKYADIITLLRKKWKMNSTKNNLGQLVKELKAASVPQDEEATDSTNVTDDEAMSIKTADTATDATVDTESTSTATATATATDATVDTESTATAATVDTAASVKTDEDTKTDVSTKKIVIRKKNKKFEDIVFKIVDGAAVAETGDIDSITVDGPKLLVIDFENCANDIYPITVRFESSKTGKAIFNYIIDAVKQLKEKSLCASITAASRFLIKNEVQSDRYICITIRMN